MKIIRQIRIVLAIIFFVAATSYLFVGNHASLLASFSAKAQILPTALAETMGATLVWLAMTFLFGRVYCSTACPLATLQDIIYWCSRKIWKRSPRYRSAANYKVHSVVFAAWVVTLVAGATAIAAVIEPWEIMKEIAFSLSPSAKESAWINVGLGTVGGVVAGICVLLIILLWAFVAGRDFCSTICPVGTGLGYLAPYSIYHIEINPDKCTNCMKCEEECPTHSIKVLSRYVDNARCVRCFRCVANCDDDAIRYQPNRNRPATPLFLRRKTDIK